MTFVEFDPDTDIDTIAFCARHLHAHELIVDAIAADRLLSRMREARVAELREQILTTNGPRLRVVDK